MRTAANVSLPHIKAIKVLYMNNFSFLSAKLVLKYSETFVFKLLFKFK